MTKPTTFSFHHHSFLFLRTLQIQHHTYRSKYAYFLTTHMVQHSLFLFSFPPFISTIHLYVSCYITSHVSSSSNLFFVVLRSPTSSWSWDLVEGEWDRRGRQVVWDVGGMGIRERLSVLQVDIHLVWEAMEWPPVICMRLPTLEGFLMSYVFV